MSKSLGNIFLVKRLFKKYPGEVILDLLYLYSLQKPLNWNSKIIDQAKNT